MGYPLSRFQQLAALCSNPDKAFNTFRSFKIVSVIVHSPEDHDFIRTIKKDFQYLHNVTGKDCAFITFLDPPNDWALQNRHWMEQQRNFTYGENCEDEDFVRLLRKRLNLPQCPSLVLTTDLLSNKYIILPTDSLCIVDQLSRIGAELHLFESCQILDDTNFMDFLHSIGEPYLMSTEDGNSLACNIADLLAVRSINGQGIDMGAKLSDSFIHNMARRAQREDAGEWVKKTLRKMKKDLDKARSTGNDENIELALERYSDYLSEYISCKNDSLPSPLSSNYRIEEPLASLRAKYEQDTVYAIRSYNKLLPALITGQERCLHYDFEDEGEAFYKQDLSPLCLYLGKIVEEEMNASIIQFLRNKNEIPMPEFFRLYDPNKSSIRIKTKNKKIHLNKKHKLISNDIYSVGMIPIGDTNCVIRHLMENGPLDKEIECFGEKNYFDLITQFGYKRNDAAHPGSMTMDDFETMYKSFQKIVAGYFPVMIRLKREMKKGPMFW